jgi:hypothetical protein
VIEMTEKIQIFNEQMKKREKSTLRQTEGDHTSGCTACDGIDLSFLHVVRSFVIFKNKLVQK